jgi:hemoglobin
MTNHLNLDFNSTNHTKDSLEITESLIKNLVDNFYSKVKIDPLIGPIFKKIIKDNWDHHLSQMYDFWSGVALSSGRYQGQPMQKHVNIRGLEEKHFVRWLSLFKKNAYSICTKEIAEFFISKANTIAESLMLGISLDLKK